MNPFDQKRLLLLTTTTGYQTESFVAAARKLGLEVVFGTDHCDKLEDPWRDGALAMKFHDPEESARRIVNYARVNTIHGIVALGDRPTPTAARAAAELDLPFHPPEAADICRDKHRARECLRAARLNVPEFARFPADSDPRTVLESHAIGFPCVLKPLALSASRGVIRANHAEEFLAAWRRIQLLLRSPEVAALREATSNFMQVESYVEGREIAVEGLMDRGRLRLLAIFDKPDPLEGPYFEETIYVTPSRLQALTQEQVAATLERAARALNLHHGPLHAELRINARGVWPLEIAARSIGGLCSKALRFWIPVYDENVSLEELLIRLALGLNVSRVFREECASGVMMIPIPRRGYYQQGRGVEEARETAGVEEVIITAKEGQKLVPLPEGSSYLGFIFARGETPGFVEDALRRAHAKLGFEITLELPVIRAG